MFLKLTKQIAEAWRGDVSLTTALLLRLLPVMLFLVVAVLGLLPRDGSLWVAYVGVSLIVIALATSFFGFNVWWNRRARLAGKEVPSFLGRLGAFAVSCAVLLFLHYLFPDSVLWETKSELYVLCGALGAVIVIPVIFAYVAELRNLLWPSDNSNKP